MKSVRPFAFGPDLLWVAMLSATLPAQSDAAVVDRVVAIVDKDIVTLRELEQSAREAGALEGGEGEKKRKAALKKVLKESIREKLIESEIKKNRAQLDVKDADVERAIEGIIQNAQATREQLQQALYAEGISWSEYRSKIKNQLERSRLIDMRVRGRIKFSQDEVVQRCEKDQSRRAVAKVCASQILVAKAKEDSADERSAKRAKAQEILGELRGGESFKRAVKEHSDDTFSPTGDIGCFGRGEMVEAFEAAAFATAEGEYSDIIDTELGFHIIRVDKVQYGKQVCTEATSTRRYEEILFNESFERELDRWVSELRENAHVEVLL